MTRLRALFFRRTVRWLVGGGALAVLLLGALTTVRAQSQICRDVNNINVCGDILVAEAGTQFHLRGNIKIGPKGLAKVVHVNDMPSQFNGSALAESTYTAQYFHLDANDPNTGAKDFLLGEVKFINDPTGLLLMGTQVIDDPALSDPNQVVVGRFFVDPVNRRIFLPAANAVPVFNQKGIKRNAAYRLAFTSQAGALTFYKDGGSVDALALVDAEFDLNTKVFKAVLPVDLKLNDAAENPNLRLNMRFQWTETRQFTGGIDGFKYAFGGLLMDVAGVVFKLPEGATPAFFEAATVKVLKSDNPGVPNLDPTDPSLIFAFSKLRYKNGAWELGGVEVPIKEWEFGSAFKMVSQTLGIINEGGTTQALQIKSTMQFGAGADASKLPIVLKIGRTQVNGVFRPTFSAGLQNIAPKLGTFKFNLTGASFVGDPGQNFYGIQATSAALQWPPHLGGQTAAGVNGFKLGVDKDKKFKFQLGSGTVSLPQFENNVFRGTLVGTVGVVSETLTITGTGTFNIKLPGNANSAGIVTTAIMRYNKNVDTAAPALAMVASPGALIRCKDPVGTFVTCPGEPPPPPPPGPKPFELKLTGFSFKLAGFGVAVTNPRGTADGGFAADNVAVSLPIGMNSSMSSGSGITVQGFAIAGSGGVNIQGGGFELAPITVGSVQFAGLKGTFLRKTDGSYEFQAAGKLPLPGIEPGTNGGGIGVSLVVRLANNGNFGGVGVTVDFGSPPLPPIPIGSTGMNLTKITGNFDLNNQTVTIGMTLTATSKFQIPLGSLGSLPIAKANGSIVAQFNPFKLVGNTSLSILIFQVASASVRIGAGEGFNNADGMNAQVNVNAAIVQGLFKMRAGKGVPSNPEKRRFAANATFILGIPANQYGVGRPPFNLGGIQVQLAGGLFTDTNFNPARETSGVKGSICGPNGNICIGIFLNIGQGLGSGNFVDFTNIEKYVLIPAAAIRAAAARGEPGFASRVLSPAEASELGLIVSAAQIDGTEQILEDAVDVTQVTTATLLVGINYPSGAPVLRLRLPNGTILTEQSVNNTTQSFLRETGTVSGTNLIFAIENAGPGVYKLLIDNAPATYELVSYTLNEQPTVNLVSVACSGANVQGITVTCTNARDAADVDLALASGVTVKWNAADVDSPNATVAVGYVKDPGSPDAVDYAAINFVAEDLPLGAGTRPLNLSEAGTGKVRVVVAVDDKQNGIALAVSDTVIDVVDLRAPAVPGGLAAVSQAGELLIRWNQNGEGDLAGYEIGFGLVNDPNQFIYSRNMGPKEIVTGTNNIVDAKIWGLDDNVTVFYGLRAYDNSGNYSAWTPLQSAQPWALAPNTWYPVPNGSGSGRVSIAFAVPVLADKLETALVVKDASGNPLAGVYTLLTDAETANVVGIEFIPTDPYDGAMTATLTGGPNGVKAEDGRTMGGNYNWSFAFSTPRVLLPLVQR